MESLINEVTTELSLVPEDQARTYLLFTAGIMKWAATGDVDDLPAALKADIRALPSSDETVAYQ